MKFVFVVGGVMVFLSPFLFLLSFLFFSFFFFLDVCRVFRGEIFDATRKRNLDIKWDVSIAVRGGNVMFESAVRQQRGKG